MALGTHVIALMVRLGDIEENINNAIGEADLLKFTDTIIYARTPDVLQKGIGKYWFKLMC